MKFANKNFRSLIKIYKEQELDMSIFYNLYNKINNALKCPCTLEKKCIHNFKADHCFFDTVSCEAGRVYLEMKIKIINILHKYFYDDEYEPEKEKPEQPNLLEFAFKFKNEYPDYVLVAKEDLIKIKTLLIDFHVLGALTNIRFLLGEQ